ncbi:MAG: hypothetical protein P9L97_05895 [Candidatus Tenebribacter davisii]|nr:hypothetical protein [Candidatus Tenebribacter davisii]
MTTTNKNENKTDSTDSTDSTIADVVTTTAKKDVKDLDIELTVKNFIESKVEFTDSFTFIKEGRKIASLATCKAFHSVGEIGIYFKKNYSQKQGALLRTEALKDLNLSKNDVSASMKLFEIDIDSSVVVEKFSGTGCLSINPQRILKAILAIGKEDEEVIADPEKILKALVVALERAGKHCDPLEIAKRIKGYMLPEVTTEG